MEQLLCIINLKGNLMLSDLFYGALFWGIIITPTGVSMEISFLLKGK